MRVAAVGVSRRARWPSWPTCVAFRASRRLAKAAARCGRRACRGSCRWAGSNRDTRGACPWAFARCCISALQAVCGAGFEPATSALTVLCSIRLSYPYRRAGFEPAPRWSPTCSTCLSYRRRGAGSDGQGIRNGSAARTGRVFEPVPQWFVRSMLRFAAGFPAANRPGLAARCVCVFLPSATRAEAPRHSAKRRRADLAVTSDRRSGCFVAGSKSLIRFLCERPKQNAPGAEPEGVREASGDRGDRSPVRRDQSGMTPFIARRYFAGPHASAPKLSGFGSRRSAMCGIRKVIVVCRFFFAGIGEVCARYAFVSCCQ